MIKIVVVGKIKEKSLQALIDEYLKRIKYFTKVSLIEVDDEAIGKNGKEEDKVKQVEGSRVLRHIGNDEFVCLLDLHGKAYDSIFLAKELDKAFNRYSKITFVIGGSLGLSLDLINRADVRWKLSDCTFPHQIVRLLVVEQIYRFFAINNNLPYHK